MSDRGQRSADPPTDRRPVGRAVVERVKLRRIEFVYFELWELDADGGKARLLHLAPVRTKDGRLNAADLALARATLTADARKAGVTIVRAAW